MAETLTIRADGEGERSASAWLASRAAAHGVPDAEIRRLDQCLDEALANVIQHGGGEAVASPLQLRFEVRRNGETCTALVTLSDAGIAFDPLAAPRPQRPSSLSEAKPGGLGLVMIRVFSDVLAYRRSEGRNHFSFGVTWITPQ